MMDAALGCAFWGVSVLAREYAVRFETVSKVRAERHKVHARLVKSAIDDVVAHFGLGRGVRFGNLEIYWYEQRWDCWQ